MNLSCEFPQLVTQWMLLPEFCAERKHYFRNASWACLSEDLANMQKKKKKKKSYSPESEATLQRITVFKGEFKETAFKQKEEI